MVNWLRASPAVVEHLNFKHVHVHLLHVTDFVVIISYKLVHTANERKETRPILSKQYMYM